MLDPTPIVFVIDEDVSVRESVADLVLDAGLQSRVFASARDFVQCPRPTAASCLVLDIGLPDLEGLELPAHVVVEQAEMPVIFVASSPNVRLAVRALKAGALEFLSKPLDRVELLSAVLNAIDLSRKTLAGNASLRVLQARHERLSVRERQVMALVTAGHLNKQVGGQLGISEITVKAHRGRVMQKMQAASLVHLVDMARRLGMAPAPAVERGWARTTGLFEPMAWA